MMATAVPGGHAEKGQYTRIARCRKQHDGRYHDRIQNKNDRRIDRIAEIGFLHRPIAFADICVILLFHVGFFIQAVNGSDIMQGFRHMSGRPADRFPVLHLRRQHAFLYAPRERKQEQAAVPAARTSARDCETR